MWKSSSLSKQPQRADSPGALRGGAVCVVLAVLAFAADRATKVLAVRHLRGAQPVALIEGVLRLMYVENSGAAFGLLSGRPALLAAVTGIVLLAMLIGLLGWGHRLPRMPRAAAWVLLGGALGNLYDRVRFGYVVDFLDIRMFRFPVFNIADACVCVAFALLAGWVLFGKEAKRDGG